MAAKLLAIHENSNKKGENFEKNMSYTNFKEKVSNEEELQAIAQKNEFLRGDWWMGDDLDKFFNAYALVFPSRTKDLNKMCGGCRIKVIGQILQCLKVWQEETRSK